MFRRNDKSVAIYAVLLAASLPFLSVTYLAAQVNVPEGQTAGGAKSLGLGMKKIIQNRIGFPGTADEFVMGGDSDANTYVLIQDPVFPGEQAGLSIDIKEFKMLGEAQREFKSSARNVIMNYTPLNPRGWDQVMIHSGGIVSLKGRRMVIATLSGLKLTDYLSKEWHAGGKVNRNPAFKLGTGLANFLFDVIAEHDGVLNSPPLMKIEGRDPGPLTEPFSDQPVKVGLRTNNQKQENASLPQGNKPSSKAGEAGQSKVEPIVNSNEGSNWILAVLVLIAAAILGRMWKTNAG